MGVSKGMEFIDYRLKMQLLGGKITRVIVGLQQLHGWLDSSFARNSPSETPVEVYGHRDLSMVRTRPLGARSMQIGQALKLLLINVRV